MLTMIKLSILDLLAFLQVVSLVLGPLLLGAGVVHEAAWPGELQAFR